MNLHLPSTVVLVAHWLILTALSVRVIMRRPPVGVSVAWLAVIFSVPFVGAAAHLLVGERRLGRRRALRIAASIGDVRQWQNDLRYQYDTAVTQIEATAEPIHRHAEHVLGFPALPGNNIELLDNFQTIFDAIVADIDGAQSRCHVCFYIWHEGGRATDVVDALVRTARRGVQCRALADATGSKAFLRGRLARRLRDAGVELTAALPTGPLRTFFVRRDLRNHRKRQRGSKDKGGQAYLLTAASPDRLSGHRRQGLDVRQQLLLVSQADEVEADHLDVRRPRGGPYEGVVAGFLWTRCRLGSVVPEVFDRKVQTPMGDVGTIAAGPRFCQTE